MKIIICGAGLSGRAIAEKLSQIGNEVTIIDSSKRLIEKLGNKLDIRGIVGHGAHPDILGEAGAAEAEMLISVTPSDEINMMACQVAHSLLDSPDLSLYPKISNYYRQKEHFQKRLATQTF